MSASLRLILWLPFIVALYPLSATGAVPGKSMLDGIPSRSEVLAGYERDSAMSRLGEMPLHIVEGIWEFASEGTLMAIERVDGNVSGRTSAATLYRMVAVRGADMALRPGTVMGYLSTTSKRGVYDARIYTSRSDDGTVLSSAKTFTLTLTDEDSRLVIKEYGKSFVFNWWRLLPYMYRYLISRRERSSGDIEGCVRVFPEPAVPLEPVYL
ncbi:MAG: hypothetical protein K2O30_10620 [Duncaniella sp.]|nr:hypothetical protein [Duncaniella sp.]MDE7146582.1 hypothetical protein [Duncaniella sp.]